MACGGGCGRHWEVARWCKRPHSRVASAFGLCSCRPPPFQQRVWAWRAAQMALFHLNFIPQNQRHLTFSPDAAI
ncbi:hypothetical protein E2C01_002004 [Portunus trituberculatus]|uniref:Uncharacterized protein n=1 Tax=Portunus trituberculatus TaxID=210409 RepID=A0A5B7CP67_PORTR|nr:hypothetical protein [Portunus trituberculatus]